MSLRMPHALHPDSHETAVSLLQRYYDPSPEGSGFYTGSLWDNWDSTGTREQDADRFTADDLVAVTLLSVEVPATAAHLLLFTRRDEFSRLLHDLGPDRDLVDEASTLDYDHPGWAVMTALRSLPGVGGTTSAKLLARKRPRLRPIWDDVVATVTDGRETFWEPLRQALRSDDRALHRQLVQLREEAGLQESVSALRVFDVLAWMEGKGQGLGRSRG